MIKVISKFEDNEIITLYPEEGYVIVAPNKEITDSVVIGKYDSINNYIEIEYDKIKTEGDNSM